MRIIDWLVKQILRFELPSDIVTIRRTYYDEIRYAILEWLVTDSTNTFKYVNRMKKAMSIGFSNAFDRGYLDGGGQLGDQTEEDSQWLSNKKAAERVFIEQLWERLRELKKEEPDEDNSVEIDARAEGYAATLDGVYAEGKLRGSKNVMLTFDGEDGEESCRECRKWKGKRHAASFWVKRGLIPGQPGNQNFSCRGYNCRHYLYDDSGNIWAGH